MILLATVVILLAINFTSAITIGTVTDKPSKRAGEYERLAEYLEKKLGIEVSIKFAKSIPYMKNLIEDGEVDLFIDSLYPSLKVCSQGACEPMMLIWRNNVKYYRSIIVVRKDSDINTIKDLVGKKLALEEPFSTAGYLVPITFLLEEGLNLFELRDFNDPVPPKRVGFVFADEEENVVGWVFFGYTDAGALYDIKFKKIVNGYSSLFRIIFSSPEIPQHIVSFSSKLEEGLKDKLANTLLNMYKTPDGKEVLKMFGNSQRFEALSDKDKELIKFFGEKIKRLGL